MTDISIKSPNPDDIFAKWTQAALKKDKKSLEKEFGVKGAVFSIENLSAAEIVKEINKEAAIYFAIKKTVAPGKGSGKDEIIVPVSKLNRETFYAFKDGSVNKDNWKGKSTVPMIETLKAVPCKTCGGKGYTEESCKTCKGSGSLQTKIDVLIGENQDNKKNILDYSCAECYGTGKIPQRCRECEGFKNQYKYEILPVPFKTVVTGIPVLHSSAQTKYEKEIERDLHEVIQEVDGIKFNEFKTLENKAEAALGYWNKAIKKTISMAGSDYYSYSKDKSVQIVTQIYLFPMMQLFCESKRGTRFEIYSIGSQNNFMVYSNF